MPAAVGLALVLLPACGLRVGSSTIHAATQAAEGTGGAGGGGVASINNGTGQSAAGATSSGQAVGAGTQSASPNGVATGPSQSSSGASPSNPSGITNLGQSSGSNTAPPAAPPSGNGGATDVGVTATSITVGNVSDLGGPVPGLFDGGPYGTQAYFDYINSQGGVYGRQLKLVSDDDSLECNQNEADYQNTVNSVFAYVGSWSLDDYCGATIMSSHKNVPIVQQALSTQFQNLPNEYSVAPYNAGAPTGYFNFFKQMYPDAIGSVGTLVGNVPSAVQSWAYYKAVMQSLGYTIKYQDEFPPAQTNFTADVIRMKTDGVKMVFIIAVNAPDLADFSQEASQQGWKPEVFVGPIGYFGTYVADSGGSAAVEGQYVPIVQARFLGEDASSNPEVARFDQWITKDHPSFSIDQFAASAWSQAALFVKILEQVGPDLTRQKVLAALAGIHSFDDDGMVAPGADIAAKTASHCYVLLQIHNGKYDRVDDPPTGYRCDGVFQNAG